MATIHVTVPDSVIERYRRRAVKAETLLRRCRGVLRTAMQEECPLCGNDEARQRVLQRRIDEINEHHREYGLEK